MLIRTNQRTQFITGLLLTILAFGVSACDDASELDARRNGAGAVEAIDADDAFANGQTWRFDRILLIGSGTGADSTLFAYITDIDVNSRGRIYVADGMAHSVRVFDPSGTLIRRIGREGQGPGEFEYPAVLEITAGDTLRVFDTDLWRTSVFSSGQYVRSFIPERKMRFGQPYDLKFSESGALYNLGYGPFRAALKENLGDRRKARVRGENTIQRWDEQEHDWIDIMSVPGLVVYANVDESSIQNAPFPRRPLWVPTGASGIWYADSGSGRVILYSQSGERLRAFDTGFDPAPVSEAQREAYYNAADLIDATPNERREARRERSDIPMPDRTPALSRLLLSEGGDLWVQQFAGEAADSVRWRVFDTGSTGSRFIANVVLPANFTLMAVSGGRLYGIQTNRLNVQHLAVYRRSEG